MVSSIFCRFLPLNIDHRNDYAQKEELDGIVLNFDDALQESKQKRQDLVSERDILKPELNL